MRNQLIVIFLTLAAILLLQAMLGLSAKAQNNVLTVNQPHLPPWLNFVELRNLRVGSSTISGTPSPFFNFSTFS